MGEVVRKEEKIEKNDGREELQDHFIVETGREGRGVVEEFKDDLLDLKKQLDAYEKLPVDADPDLKRGLLGDFRNGVLRAMLELGERVKKESKDGEIIDDEDRDGIERAYIAALEVIQDELLKLKKKPSEKEK